MKTNLKKTMYSLILASVIIFTGGGNVLISQLNECSNTPWYPNGYIGIQTGYYSGAYRPALKPLHIDSYYVSDSSALCTDPAIRLSHRQQGNNFWGHLALRTAFNDPYSVFSTQRDIILQADTNAEDVIITTRNENGNILFGTTPFYSSPDIERFRIWPSGQIHINHKQGGGTPIGFVDINFNQNYGWPHELPKISMWAEGDLEPGIRFYRAHDAVTNYAHTWRIYQNYYNLEFMSKIDVVTPGVYSGSNPDDPSKVVEFQRDGTVVFHDNTVAGYTNDRFPGNSGTSYTETRLIWSPQKSAFRAGKVESTQWDYNNIGEFSVAFGLNNIASAQYSCSFGKNDTASNSGASAFGESNNVSGVNSVAFGFNNKVSNDVASAFGDGNNVSEQNSIAFGTANIISGNISIAFGTANNISGKSSFAFGDQCNATNEYSILMGYQNNSYGTHNILIGSYIGSFGTNAIALGYLIDSVGHNCMGFGTSLRVNGNSSTAMGVNVSTNNKNGSFIIGDLTGDPTPIIAPYTYSDKNNQMTMRFQGEDNCIDSNNACFRLITHVGTGVPENGLYLFHNGHGWLGYSDSSMKREITSVDIDSILIKLCNVPISTWKWKQDSVMVDSVMIYDSLSYTWLGPMAQDFYREFPIGVPNNSLLSESVMRGVTMAGVQALKRKTDSLTAEFDNVWHKTGDTINNNSFIGSLNSQPLTFKTNSTERLKISDNQVVFTVFGDPSDSVEPNAAVKIYSDSNSFTGAFIAGSETGWRTICDRNKKENFENVDFNNILSAFKNSDVTYWNYKNTPKDKKYIGPTAQDFLREFKLGGKDSTSINGLIYDGVNFAGIKALISVTDDIKDNQKNSISKEEFNSFKDSISCLADACKRIDELEKKVEELNSRLDSLIRNGGIANKEGKTPQILSYEMIDDIILEQNNPNPFSEETKINYYLPSKYEGKAKLIITDESGSVLLQSHDICIAKPCQITISAKDLSTGVYVYAITLDNKIIKTKKMIIIK